MAKSNKKQEKSKQEVFSFSELQKKLINVSPNSKIIYETPFSNIEEYFSTGNYALNAQISGSIFGGIPSGRVTLFAGDPSVGKTYLALNACREAQKKGYYIIYIDTEWAVDRELMFRFGIDASEDKVDYHPMNTVEDVNQLILTTALTLLEKKKAGIEIPRVVIVIDSLGNLSTRRELEGIMAGEEKANMGHKQMLFKKLFSTCTMNMGLVGGTIIATQHTIANIGGYGEARSVAGGIGQWFNSSTVIQLSKSKLTDGTDKKTQTGIIATSKIKKSRFTKKGIPVDFHISDEIGMNQFVGLEKFISWDVCGIEAGKINEKGNFEPADKQIRTYAVKHLGKNVKPKELLRSNIFTDEVLEKLDPVVSDIFKLIDPTSQDFDESIMSVIQPDVENDIDTEDNNEE